MAGNRTCPRYYGNTHFDQIWLEYSLFACASTRPLEYSLFACASKNRLSMCINKTVRVFSVRMCINKTVRVMYVLIRQQMYILSLTYAVQICQCVPLFNERAQMYTGYRTCPRYYANTHFDQIW